MAPTVVPPRHTVRRPLPLERKEKHYSPTPPSRSPSPVRELSPTFSIVDGHEGDGSFSGGEPSCVKLARMNTETIDWDQLRQIIAPHRGRIRHHEFRGVSGDDATVRPITRASDPTGLSELLSQPYVDLPPPLSPKPWIRPHKNSSFHLSPRPVRSASEDERSEADLSDSEADVAPETYYEVAYIPHGKYAWATGQPAGKLRSLAHLEVADLRRGGWTSALMSAVIGGQPMNVLCRSWPRNETRSSFLREFKLLSSDSYLRPLQGVVVPWIINLYNTHDVIQLFMEVPHHSFWVEASPSMSDALKQRVVEAYAKLHRAGVLHGAVEKKNIFIGGDSRVNLVNFSMARTTRPIPEIGLKGCSEREMALEMRRVRFILNYGTAQDYELRLMDKGDRRALLPRMWEEWIREYEQPSRRWLVPGGTPETYAEAVSAFQAAVVGLEKQRALEVVSPLLVLSPTSPLPIRNRASPSTDPSLLRSWQKRKASTLRTLHGAPPAKRPRLGVAESDIPPVPGPTWEHTTQCYSCATSELPRASAASATPPLVKVRDFASEPYDGPRGYYVPHPPTEMIMSSYRAAYIRNANAITCGQLGLPYWRGDESEYSLTPPGYKRPLPRGVSISLGTLKRQAEDMEDEGGNERRPSKRRRVDSSPKWIVVTAAWEEALEKDQTIRWDADVSHCMPWDYEDISEGEAMKDAQYETGGRLTEPLARPRHRDMPNPSRGILKATSPRRTVCYDLNAWPQHTEEEVLSTPLMKQCGLIPRPGRVPGRSPSRASAPEAGPSALCRDSRTSTSDYLLTRQEPPYATVDEGEAQDYLHPHTSILGSMTGRTTRAPSVRLTPAEMDDLEARQVEGMLFAWDPSLTPHENLLALADADEEMPYKMDTDVYRWLKEAMGRP
ncbi:hypothetical protein BD309DRAFT_949729 [Dichomitus squalens]|nr:hypothetical protein BD309DRAFT_949729 [Dichomitus squalens]